MCLKESFFNRFAIRWVTLLLLCGCCVCIDIGLQAADRIERNEWYWDSVVNLHIDNHSSLVGQGHSAAEIEAMISDISVDMVQVSAYGAVGNSVTYPTKRLPELLNPQLDGYDTLGVWRDAVTACGKRFHVYLNTRGLLVHKKHPHWLQQDALGRGRARRPGQFDACPRPSPDGDGYLESMLLPLLQEVSEYYHPGGFWVDGDHARTRVCYCVNCRKAWRLHTGQTKPPADAGHPDWPKWLQFEQERYDEYRRLMAKTVHDANPIAMYTSNHSWRKTYSTIFEKIDPRDPPAFVGRSSADLSHGLSLRQTRLSAMLLSADQDTPRDIMHLINSSKISKGRVLQEGAITLSFGGPWFLWVSGSTIVQPEAQQRARLCAQFARDRAQACGLSVSRNPYAVLVSETTWAAERHGKGDGYLDFLAANHFALALQDAACCVDLVNESLLRQHAQDYRCIVVPNQRVLAGETVAVLDQFVHNGGVVLVTGSALRPNDQEDPTATEWMGIRRTKRFDGESQIVLDNGPVSTDASWAVKLTGAKTLAEFADGRPALTVRGVGKGRVFWLSIERLSLPEPDGLVPWMMQLADLGPCFRIDSPADTPHIVMAVRRKQNRTVYHLTDLTTHIHGQRVPPDKSDIIDDPSPIEELSISLPMPVAPAAVSVVPSETHVSHAWNDGVLLLRLKRLHVHAAILVEGADNTPAALLPADTPKQNRFAWSHYDDPRSLFVSFETEAHGHKQDPFADCVVRQSGPLAIRATAETASHGRSSAKFIDGPGQQAFLPYLHLRPFDLSGGTLKFSADFRLGRDSIASLEFRTVENRRTNPVGPSIRARADGTLVTEQGEKLLVVPHDQWFGIEVTCPLGSGHYDCRITVPGEQPRMFKKLPCVGGAAFRRCGWIGVCSNAREKSEFYLDNIRVEREK